MKLDAYISFIGIAMGVKIYITYSDWINFRAEFYLRPMDLCFGVIKISDAVAKSGNAVRTNGPQPAEFAGGPYAIFDSKALSIDISGSVCVLGSCSSIIVQVSKTRLYFQQASTFLGFPFATSVWATFGALPLKFGTKWEAGNEGTSLKITIRNRVNAKLDELKRSGEGAIKDAQGKLESARSKVNNVCEEMADLELLEQVVRAHKAKRDSKLGRKLLAAEGKAAKTAAAEQGRSGKAADTAAAKTAAAKTGKAAETHTKASQIGDSTSTSLVDGLLSDTVEKHGVDLIQAKGGSRTKWHTHWPHRHHFHVRSNSPSHPSLPTSHIRFGRLGLSVRGRAFL